MMDFHYTDKKKPKVYRNVAEHYNELTGDQLIRIANLFLLQVPKDLADLQALHILLGCSKYEFFMLHCHWKACFLPHIQWVFEKNKLTDQLLPEYKGMYGPASDFDNLTMKEWDSCERYYELMVKYQDDSAIDFIIAVLYREPKANYDTAKNPEGDIRKPYNPNELEYWAAKIKDWPAAVKFAIIMWYDGCREMIRKTYKVFDSPKKSGSDQEPGMFEMVRALAGDKYGSFFEVEELNVHLVMREMESLKREAKEFEKNLPKATA